MEAKQFNWLVDKRCEAIKKILVKKGEEYSSDIDRLHNFKSATGFTKASPEESLWGMMVKHLVSVKDIVDNCKDPKYVPSTELMEEKITDSLNYLILLEALLTERKEKQQLPF